MVRIIPPLEPGRERGLTSVVKTSTHILDGIELLGRCANNNAQHSCYNGSKRGIHDYCEKKISESKQGRPMAFWTSHTANLKDDDDNDDDARLRRRLGGLKQEGKRRWKERW